MSALACYADACGGWLVLFDIFDGFDIRHLVCIDQENQVIFSDTSLPMVKIVIGAANLACDFVPGYFSGSLSEHHRAARYDVVSKLRCVQTDESGPGVFYSRTSKEGLFLHDYGSAVWAGVMLAIDEFRRDTGDCIMLMSDKSESVLIRKPH